MRARQGVWLLLALSLSAGAQTLSAPELALGINEPDAPPTGGGRFEFAKVPEVVFIRGIPQTIQMGYYQIDYTNPWPAGDVERTSGWLSKRSTRLLVEGGSLPPQFTYNDRTGELKYTGGWSGDLTVRIAGDTVQSNPFRIRVLTPTIVWGDKGTEINEAQGWNARVCTRTFSECSRQFLGGSSDIAPLVVFFTPGTYSGQDWYIGPRPFVYLLGDPTSRPTLVNDELSASSKQMYYVSNLNLRNAGVLLSGYPKLSYAIILRNVYQCCETADNNGLMNPGGATGPNRFEVYWHASESKGMGGLGNTTHAAYIESRPNSLFDVNNLRVLGTRGSSAIKTTMNELNVRHSLLHVAESMEDLKNGVCVHPGTSTGCLMHTPLDFPGYTTATIYANKFVVWRQTTVGVPDGRSGILAGTIFVRQRGNSIGSDTPNYPNKSWDPPVSSQSTKLPPCYQWDGTATTFVADQFWRDVRKVPLNSELNPCTFKHFISFNTFEQLPGSLGVYAVRDDGTYPANATSQFATTVNIFRNHPLWVERSTSFLYGNTFLGATEGRSLYQLNREPNVRYIEPLSFWPRDPPDQYPRVVEVPGEELPSWFKL